MSLTDAQRLLRWNAVMEALADAKVDAETIAMVEAARDAGDVANRLARMLLGSADTAQAKNYVKIEMVGVVLPFERLYVELVRPGGKTSHELRELLRNRLAHVRSCLQQKEIARDPFREEIVAGIDEDLEKEKP